MSTKARTGPGRWISPITPSSIAGKTLQLTETAYDRTTGGLYWGEGRPAEGGRVVLRKKGSGGDLTGKESNVRANVNEYGGGAFGADYGKIVYTDLKASRVFLQDAQGETRAITPSDPKMRYANFDIHPKGKGAFAVVEDHTHDSPAEVRNSLAYIDFDKGAQVIVAGADFYSTPKSNRKGDLLAWIEWNHPNMSWNGTELYIARWDDEKGVISGKKKIKGEPGKESCLQPCWLDDGRLLFLSDETGYYQLYISDPGKGEVKPVLARPTESEFGITEWIFNQPTFDSVDRHGKIKIVAIETRAAVDNLVEIDLGTGLSRKIDSPYVSIASLRATGPDMISFIGVTETDYRALVEFNLDTGEAVTIQRSTDSIPEPEYCSRGQSITFPTDGGRKSHALLYLPQSKDYRLDTAAGEKAPLIVSAHGGPTTHARLGLATKIAYWTSRGFAWLDVNYGGSSGYGKAYRDRLDGEMGIVDVQDTLNAAQFIQKEGSSLYHIDGDRIAITGSSAGGYVVLSALTAKRQGIFAAGTSYYGISSLLALLEDTHKFESRYLDRLLGSRGRTEEERKVYLDRSPLTHADRLTAPLLLLQGQEDKVVPPNQAEEMIRVVKGRTRIDFHLFPGEGHGFRRQETLEKAIELETAFYQEVMNL